MAKRRSNKTLGIKSSLLLTNADYPILEKLRNAFDAAGFAVKPSPRAPIRAGAFLPNTQA
jgi:hypothetical protein